jgi:hypothetical protein
VDPIELELTIQPEGSIQVNVTELPFVVNVVPGHTSVSAVVEITNIASIVAPPGNQETIVEITNIATIIEPPSTQLLVINEGPQGPKGDSGGGGGAGFDPAKVAYYALLRG